MTPSHHSWPPYFTPERLRDIDDRGLRATMNAWATAVLVVAVGVLIYLMVTML